MSDIQTMVKQLLREVRIDSAATGSQADTDAKIAIIDAMDSQKAESLWFNKSWVRLSLSNGEYRYPLPADFLSFSGDVTLIQASSDPTSRRKLEPGTLNEVMQATYIGTEPSESILTGTPSKYALDGGASEILFVPVPSSDGDLVEFQYLINAGIPSYRYTDSTWAFYEPGSTTALPQTFTNVWLQNDKGYKLVFYRAAYNLLTGPYGGLETSMLKATEYIKRWAEEIGRLRGENVKRSVSPTIRRHI